MKKWNKNEMIQRVGALREIHKNKRKEKEKNLKEPGKLSIWCNRFSVILQLIACFTGYFVIECLSRHSIVETWEYMFDRSWVFLYNVFIMFLTTLPVYLIRRRSFYRIFITAFWFTLGLANCIILANRVTPFTGPDLKLLSEGLGVLSKYLNSWQTTLLFIGLGLLVVALILVFIKAPRYRKKIKFKLSIPLILVSIALFIVSTKIAFDKRLLSNYFGNIAFAYEDYGYPYCLAVTLFDTGISSPTGYSETLVKHIVKSQQDDQTDVEELPNIIFVQLESFFDPTNVRYLQLSEDPIPYFRSLCEEYSSGYYTVPSVGAGTANTEFETLTGMSMRFFGPGEYPYKSVLKDNTCESAPFVLSSLGYTSHAIHNNEANFYSRKSVFSKLGFQTFTSEEFMPEQSVTTPTGWMKDSALTSKITDCLDSTDGDDFVFTISVQGHGSYPTEPTIQNPEITVDGAGSDEANCEWEYYVNEIHEMDSFVKTLVETLSKREEKTVLVLYGDHLPTLNLEENDLKNGNLFQTKYVIWNNYGLKAQKKDITSYQAMAETFDQIGIHEGTLFKFHQDEQNSELYQIDLQTLQYDMLYGEKYVYGQENPFKATKLSLGIKDTEITNIETIMEGTYYIRGNNFTPSTIVQQNGEEISSTYLNTTTILVQDYVLDDGDFIGVAIKSNSSTAKILKQNNVIVYHNNDEEEEELHMLTPTPEGVEALDGVKNTIETTIETNAVNNTER